MNLSEAGGLGRYWATCVLSGGKAHVGTSVSPSGA